MKKSITFLIISAVALVVSVALLWYAFFGFAPDFTGEYTAKLSYADAGYAPPFEITGISIPAADRMVVQADELHYLYGGVTEYALSEENFDAFFEGKNVAALRRANRRTFYLEDGDYFYMFMLQRGGKRLLALGDKRKGCGDDPVIFATYKLTRSTPSPVGEYLGENGEKITVSEQLWVTAFGSRYQCTIEGKRLQPVQGTNPSFEIRENLLIGEDGVRYRKTHTIDTDPEYARKSEYPTFAVQEEEERGKEELKNWFEGAVAPLLEESYSHDVDFWECWKNYRQRFQDDAIYLSNSEQTYVNELYSDHLEAVKSRSVKSYKELPPPANILADERIAAAKKEISEQKKLLADNAKNEEAKLIIYRNRLYISWLKQTDLLVEAEKGFLFAFEDYFDPTGAEYESRKAYALSHYGTAQSEEGFEEMRNYYVQAHTLIAESMEYDTNSPRPAAELYRDNPKSKEIPAEVSYDTLMHETLALMYEKKARLDPPDWKLHEFTLRTPTYLAVRKQYAK